MFESAANAAGQPALTLRQLQDALWSVDRAVLLLPPRLLRRVIKDYTRIRVLGLRVPHRKSLVIGREDLLSLVDPADLELPFGWDLPATVILLARPSHTVLESLPPADVLAKYWRLLFHARVHQQFDAAQLDGRLTPEIVRRRIEAIGRAEFEEVRRVLKQDDYLLPPKSDLTVYVEFAAVFWELRLFAGPLLAATFPGLFDHAAAERVLNQDFDARRLGEATQLPGATAPPTGAGHSPADEVRESSPAVAESPAATKSDFLCRRWCARAERAGRAGNLVRAALLRLRGARAASGELARHTRGAARADLDQLARRLQKALGFSDGETTDWSQTLWALAEPAAAGIWTPEGRLLYDLQKVCVDDERGIFTLDLWRWIKSLGRAPLKRRLPAQREVLLSKHLRNAQRRLPKVRVPGRAAARLEGLLQSAVHRAEGRLRARFRPTIEAALDEARLSPKNVPETVARKKLIDELLDRIVERSYLSMGDLRDALSRNQLKLPDLDRVEQLYRGDQMLAVDHRLAQSMDGVYRPGEIYLRLPQRLSSIAFGTPLGRLVTQHLVLPFGGAFLVLAFAQEISHFASQYFDFEEVHVVDRWTVGGTGSLIYLLLYSAQFRANFLVVLRGLGRVLRMLLLDLPAWLGRLPAVEAVLASREFRLFRRYLLKPLIVAALVSFGLGARFGAGWLLPGAAGTFLIASLLLNSRVGRNVDEWLTDLVAHSWHRFRIHVLTASVRFVLDLFSGLVEGIERFLYSVDEWLRFRTGENRVKTAAKAAMSVVWSAVNYVVRFCVNLLIEPQINPIKHFPVVTVSHKVLLPMTPLFVAPFIGPLGKVWANTVGTTIVLGLPGVIGFVVWELKENWRLYAANRPATLRPVGVGHHGETVLGLLRPGFRSGTLPKLFARLRRAQRKALRTGNWRAAAKQAEHLHHVEEEVRRFVDREFLALLAQSRNWTGGRITTGEIHLAVNRLEVELYCPELSEDSPWIGLEDCSGWLVARVESRGWLGQLEPAARQSFGCALVGFYKLAGVDVVHEQVEHGLGAMYARKAERGLAPLSSSELAIRGDIAGDDTLSFDYTVSEDGLHFRAGGWRGRAPIERPRGERAEMPAAPSDDRSRLIFSATSITWQMWVVAWHTEQTNLGAPTLVLPVAELVPGV